jgi:cyclopropane fatty-acyl-phospholipid synthase-like methyltransferase
MSIPDRSTFTTAYEGVPPWDVDQPQPAFVAVAEQIQGDILDVGCGTGENALYFAARGHQVTGIDFIPEAIDRARRKAQERGLNASFIAMDALALPDIPRLFDAVIDSGLFHVFGDEDRKRYVDGLASILRPNGRLFLLCFSQEEPGTHGPRRIAEREIDEAFSRGWRIESKSKSRYLARTDHPDAAFSKGGAKAWFVIARKLP